MSSLSRELVFLILQFLDEEKFKETVHKLEQESGFFFNMKYFEDQAQAGEWDEVERYLSGFTKVDDNRYSMKIFFEIRKQKYLEALDSQDRTKAVEILVKDLKVFSAFNEDLYKEITQLLTLENFRENEQLSKYGDTKSARSIMLLELKKLIEANPLFRDKLAFPVLKASRLRTLINQSLNWQHQLCKNPRPNPDIKTLFVDHSCGPANGARGGPPPPPPANPLSVGMPKAGVFPPLGGHGPFAPSTVSTSSPLTGWMANPTPNPSPQPQPQPPPQPQTLHQLQTQPQLQPPHAVVTVAQPGVTSSQNPVGALLNKRPRTPPGNAPGLDYQTGDSENLLKRGRPPGPPMEEVTYPVSNLPMNGYTSDDLPKAVARTLNQGSNVISMDFHPAEQTLLLVGTNVGDIAIWEVSCKERLVIKPFKLWDISTCSVPLQSALVKDPVVSVSRTMWSPEGTFIGVAFSKHMVQIYQYSGRNDLRPHLEIDAHLGAVNDLAFSHPNKQLCAVTCGDDKLIKVWNAITGHKLYTFEGHEASVYSVCPHHKENIQFIFSTAIDGKIKAWLYDHKGSRVDYDAPGYWCTTMAYSGDGQRLFSCGTSKEGESYLVEWNESEGAVKRTYGGFRKRSLGVVQFDTTKSRFLVAGDDFQIKFWDMDNTSLLATIDAEGGLLGSSRVRFNKEGSLLAVTTNDNGIKILANGDGMRLLRMLESRAFDLSRGQVDTKIAKPSTTNPITLGGASTAPGIGPVDRMPTVVTSSGMIPSAQNGMDSTNRSTDIKPRIVDEVSDKNKPWKMTEISNPTQCRSVKLPDTLPAAKISRLLYTNAGGSVLALCSNAVHKLWKWQVNERNTCKATASVAPQLCQPSSGILMTNDISDTKPEDATACIALSKNDSYVMSASGGKVSLFNMITFKVMTTFMQPPPAATFLVFHPQDNNIIAVGMEDSSIQIYNVRVDEVKSTLKGHESRITGLAFSNSLNVLVSSGADEQLCVWSTDSWEKRKCKGLQIQAGGAARVFSGDTRVQFHHDHIRLLVVHECQLAIYDTSKLEKIRQWTPRDTMPSSISNATYSCDSQHVYASFVDGSIGVFEGESLRPRCRLASSAYLPAGVNSSVAFPLVVAAHPSEPNQFAVGLSDGSVEVIEPLESEGKWGVPPPPVVETRAMGNGTVGSIPPNSSIDQVSR